MPNIVLDRVTKTYRDRAERRTEVGVQDVELTIKQGEFVFVIGSSGAGKSTLLQLITGQLKPTHGRVYIGDRDLQWMQRWTRSRASLLFGQVWQEPLLVRKQTIQENLMMAAMAGNLRRESYEQLQLRVKKVLGLVGMAGVERKYPVEMSTGECRRVELARALIHSPPILVLDEITANLDGDSIWDMFHLLRELNHKGTTVIMATHASQYVNILRRRVVTMVDGEIYSDIEKGTYRDVAKGIPPARLARALK